YVAMCALIAGVFPPYKTQDGDRISPLYTSRRPYAAAEDDVRTQAAAVRFVGRDPRLKVAAQYHLLPHLAGRPSIYELDHAPEADVVALQLNGGTWPDGRPSWRRRVTEDWATGRFHVAFCESQTVVLYRGPEPSVPCPSWDALLAGAAAPARELEPELDEVGGARNDLAHAHLALAARPVDVGDGHFAHAAAGARAPV